MNTRWLILFAVLCSSTTAHAQSLEAAYGRELQVLRSERTQLKRAIEEADASSVLARTALERDIAALTDELVGLRGKNASRAATRPAPVDQAQQLQVGQLLDQVEAAAALQELPVGEPSPDALPATRLQQLVEASFARLSERGGLRIRRGQEVFDERGVAQKADVLFVGEVGAVRWGGSYPPLVRTLDGSLRTMAAPRGHVATTGAGQAVSTVMFDPREPPRPGQYVARDVWDKLEVGGLLMWPLLLMGLLVVLVALERVIGLGLLGRRAAGLEESLSAWQPPDVGVGRVPAEVDSDHWFALPAVRVIQSVGTTRPELEERAAQDLLEVRPRLMRRLSVLSVTAGAAPLIGLLGTVTGMIRTFSVITDHGTGDPQLFAGGISEALLTTQLGLAVAIPALLMHSGLSRWATRLADGHQSLIFDLVQRAGTRAQPAGLRDAAPLSSEGDS